MHSPSSKHRKRRNSDVMGAVVSFAPAIHPTPLKSIHEIRRDAANVLPYRRTTEYNFLLLGHRGGYPITVTVSKKEALVTSPVKCDDNLVTKWMALNSNAIECLQDPAVKVSFHGWLLRDADTKPCFDVWGFGYPSADPREDYRIIIGSEIMENLVPEHRDRWRVVPGLGEGVMTAQFAGITGFIAPNRIHDGYAAIPYLSSFAFGGAKGYSTSAILVSTFGFLQNRGQNGSS